MNTQDRGRKRRYWVVSPNVNNDRDQDIVAKWKKASIAAHAAFMGYGPNNAKHQRIGARFAHDISQRDVILIARRHKKEPDIVAVGIAHEHRITTRGIKIPEPGKVGSLWVLSSFKTLANRLLPPKVPFMRALGHTMALVRLHPSTNKAHHEICKWMLRHLSSKIRTRSDGDSWTNSPDYDDREIRDARVATPRRNKQLDYTYRTRERIKRARRSEEELMQRYRSWLAQDGHILKIARYHQNIECDALEESRGNLIEAKSSVAREYIRMAVGQLLDYEFQGKRTFGRLNKAILLPGKPKLDVERWLQSLKIGIIWPEKRTFQDNAHGKFT